MRLHKLFLSGVALGALTLPVMAADLPVKARMPVAEVVYDWTGFYIGGHVGGGWSDSAGTATMQRFTGGGTVPHPLQSGSFDRDGYPFAGLQAGYNWQFGRYVAGIETDISFAARYGRISLAEGPITDSVSDWSNQWFGTVRGRIGYLVDPRVLLYVTGGLAYGDLRHRFNQTITGPGPIGTFFLTNSSGVRTSYAVGGGVEYKLDPRWSVKGEYQYLGFNGVSSTNTIVFNAGQTGVFKIAAGAGEHTGRIGLNYGFWK
jgi:outer membrane immunogenic protein